jgi:hypothetical protein
MDDGITISNDKRELQKLLADISAECQRLGIALNSKTRIFRLSEGFTYLGCRYRLLAWREGLQDPPILKKEENEKTYKEHQARAALVAWPPIRDTSERLSEHKLTAKIAATLKKEKKSQTAVNSKETSS